MAELNEFEWEIAGLLVQGITASKWSVAEDEGLDDAADMALQSTQLGGDGQVVTLMRLEQRTATITLELDPTDEDDKAAQLALLRAAMAPSVDRKTPKVMRWRRPGEETRRFYFLPAGGRSLEIPGDLANVQYSAPRGIKAHLFGADPVIYSDAVTDVSYSAGASHVITNAGTLAATSAGAYSLSLTASGTVVRPFLQMDDFTGERVVVEGTATTGQVVRIDADRNAYINNVWTRTSGAGGSPVAGWPILRPGANDLTIGATSGSFSATFSYRSTW